MISVIRMEGMIQNGGGDDDEGGGIEDLGHITPPARLNE